MQIEMQAEEWSLKCTPQRGPTRPQGKFNPFEADDMKFALRAFSLSSCMAVLLAAAPLAHADITSATVYENVPNSGNAGDPANMAATLPSANFSIGALGIDFTSPPSAYTVQGFLNNPTFSGQVNGFNPAASALNIELVISGTIFLNAGSNSFQVGHDDGVVLTMPGIGAGTFGNIVNQPGPTGLVTTPFTVTNPGAAGSFAFTLDYTECCGAPADLIFAVNSAPVGAATPEPSSFALFGSGLLAAAGMVRRRIIG
jgi:hypothetical protein